MLRGFTGFFLALSIIWVLIRGGGTRLPYALEAFIPLGISGVLACVVVWRQGIAWKGAATPLISFVLFLGYVMIRCWTSPVEYLALSDLFTAIACVLIYLICAFCFRDTKARKLIAATLVALAVLELFVGIRQFTTGTDEMLFGLLRPSAGHRASGTLSSPNHYAALLEVLGSMALSFAIWSSWQRSVRAILAGVGFLSFVGIAFSASRAGVISAGVILLVLGALFLWFTKKLHSQRFLRTAVMVGVLTVVIGCGSVFAMLQSKTIRPRLDALVVGAQSQSLYRFLDVRLVNWKAAWKQFRVSPAIGTGAGTHYYFGRVFRYPQLQSDPVHAHCEYLELLAEYGIVGFGLFAFCAVVHAAAGVKSLVESIESAARRNTTQTFTNENLAIAVGAISSVVALVVHCVVDFPLHVPGIAMLVAVILALLPPSVSVEDHDGREPILKKGTGFYVVLFSLFAFAILLIIISLMRLKGESLAESARIAVRDRRYDDALADGARAILHAPRNPFLYYYLGQAHAFKAAGASAKEERLLQVNAARDALRTSLALFPMDQWTWVQLGRAEDLIGNYRAAQKAYQTAIELDPNCGVLYGFYAAHLRKVGRTEQADQARSRGLELQKFDHSLSVLAIDVLPDEPVSSLQ